LTGLRVRGEGGRQRVIQREGREVERERQREREGGKERERERVIQRVIYCSK
jgi:hypothetical protein